MSAYDLRTVLAEPYTVSPVCSEILLLAVSALRWYVVVIHVATFRTALSLLLSLLCRQLAEESPDRAVLYEDVKVSCSWSKM